MSVDAQPLSLQTDGAGKIDPAHAGLKMRESATRRPNL